MPITENNCNGEMSFVWVTTVYLRFVRSVKGGDSDRRWGVGLFTLRHTKTPHDTP